MKTEIMHKGIKQQYPILKVTVQATREMDGGECVVLFTAPRKGIVMADNSKEESHCVGDFRTDWIESNFEPFSGKVVLEN